MEIQSASGAHTYRLGKQVAESDLYRLYLCVQVETGRRCLLQIAAKQEFNGDLDRNAFMLKLLEERANVVEEEYAKISKGPRDKMNYGLTFPELVDSFIFHEQGDRRINILAFRHVDDPKSLIPLINLTEIDGVRVDLQSSIWIMGKLLKTIAFMHSEGVTINMVTGKNILIDPDQHYVVIFDLSMARAETEKIPSSVRREEIAAAARAVIVVMGGDPETEFIPDDGEEARAEYGNFILDLARKREMSAERAHKAFYELVDQYWKRGFHPFTVKPLGPETYTS